MDDPLQELENELKALRPCRPSVLLRARVERDLTLPAAAASASAPVPVRRYATATTLRSWKWTGWQLAAAAAAVALVVSLGYWRSRPGPDGLPPEYAATGQPAAPQSVAPAPTAGDRLLASTAPRDAYRPVKASNLLYDLQDEGPALMEDNTPGRRVRARYVDSYTWKNPATNASLKWSVPREEIRVLPTNYH